MKTVVGKDAKEAEKYFREAALAASKATCRRAHCGTVIVSGDMIIGEGYNSPPLNQESNRTCSDVFNSVLKPKYDKTCCIHAEWRAMLDACKRHPAEVDGSTLYFMRIDDNGGFTDAGQPFCTVCSRLAMEAGIATFVLWNQDSIYAYDTDEYDRTSYNYYS